MSAVFGKVIKDDPLQWAGRYIRDGGHVAQFGTQIIDEFLKSKKTPEEFIEYIMQYHWYRLTNCKLDLLPVAYPDYEKAAASYHHRPVYFGNTVIDMVTKDSIEYFFETSDLWAIEVLWLAFGNQIIAYRRSKDNTEWQKVYEFNLGGE